MAAGSAGATAIPDTTLAINSPKPMSQRVVHYEIDAKYDAVKHIVDADRGAHLSQPDRAGARPFSVPPLSECDFSRRPRG